VTCGAVRAFGGSAPDPNGARGIAARPGKTCGAPIAPLRSGCTGPFEAFFCARKSCGWFCARDVPIEPKPAAAINSATATAPALRPHAR
jgi:hypothetical protein